jgi:hypothetical protein
MNYNIEIPHKNTKSISVNLETIEKYKKIKFVFGGSVVLDISNNVIKYLIKKQNSEIINLTSEFIEYLPLSLPIYAKLFVQFYPKEEFIKTKITKITKTSCDFSCECNNDYDCCIHYLLKCDCEKFTRDNWSKKSEIIIEKPELIFNKEVELLERDKFLSESSGKHFIFDKKEPYGYSIAFKQPVNPFPDYETLEYCKNELIFSNKCVQTRYAR